MGILSPLLVSCLEFLHERHMSWCLRLRYRLCLDVIGAFLNSDACSEIVKSFVEFDTCYLVFIRKTNVMWSEY
jgi:hypothetical protein